MAFWTTLDQIVVEILRTIALLCFVSLILLLSAVVFVRFVPVASLGWSDEIVEWAFAWMVFMGTAALWHDNEHFRVTWLECCLYGKKSGQIVDIIVKILSITFLAVMTYYSFNLMIRAHDRSPILELPRHLWYACIPLSGFLMIIYSIRNLVQVVLHLIHGTQKTSVGETT
jgi:TRAP-type transport system small permease protein